MKHCDHHLLSAIYDLLLAPTDWPIVLRPLAKALNSPCAASVITTPDRDTPRSLGVVGITPNDHCAFLHTWHSATCSVFGQFPLQNTTLNAASRKKQTPAE